MNALRESYPAINSIKNELTMLIGIVTVVVTISNFIVIFSNTNIIYTYNKAIWMYDFFAILFWLLNVGSWLATYWNIINDNQIIHLLFFMTPLMLAIWGTVVVSNVKVILVSSLWQLFLVSYISSIVLSTIFIVFIVIEVKKIKSEEEQGINLDNDNGVIRKTYRLMTNSDYQEAGYYTKLNSEEEDM